MKERLKILLDANVISAFAYEATDKASLTLYREWGTDLTADHVQMVMTHFARALDRIVCGEPISEGLCSDILEEIIQDDCYPEVARVNTLMCQHSGGLEIPKTENSFFISNLYSIYVNR